MTNEELEQKVKRLEEQLTEVRIELLERKVNKKPYEVEVPEDIEDYVYIVGSGNIYDADELSYDVVKDIYKRGVIFKNKEEAEQYDKERILLFKLHKWAEEHNEGWTPKWNNNNINYYVAYDYNGLTIKWGFCYREFTKLPYFKSEEIAKQFIKEFGDEIKEVLC